MEVAGLFAGIGGLESGLAAAGYHSRLLCEIEPAAKQVLQARFPDVELASDICDLAELPPEVDVLCAGFPCQDLSQAGRTAGLSGTRSSLVSHVFRLLTRRPVEWVVLENVPFMLQLNGGHAMAHLVSSLEQLGYAWAYRVVNSMAFGLPQRRERVFIVASRSHDPGRVLFVDDATGNLPETKIGELAHGFYWTEGVRGLGWAVDAVPTLKNGSTIGIPSPPAVLLPGGMIVQPDIRDAERLQGFPADWTAPAEEIVRSSRRWSLVGNAVSVPVAAWVGRSLRELRDWDEGLAFPLTGTRWPTAAICGANGPRAVKVSKFPVRVPRPHLHDFLRFPGRPLSARATAGFLKRTRSAKLNFPPGFIPAVEAHLSTMGGQFAAAAE